jgi:hypothetical protein
VPVFIEHQAQVRLSLEFPEIHAEPDDRVTPHDPDCVSHFSKKKKKSTTFDFMPPVRFEPTLLINCCLVGQMFEVISSDPQRLAGLL